MMDEVELCFPELGNSSCRKPALHWSEAVLLNIPLSFISLITAALNLLVIISVSHYRQLHTPTNILLLSLAVSDFLVGVVVLPQETLLKTSCWFLGDLLCSLSGFLSFIITSASVGGMVLISIDRYVAVCDPLHYPVRITVTRVKFSVCLCWFCSVFHNGLILMMDLTQPGRYKSCHGECVIFINYIAGVADLVLTFIAPITVIIILYGRVFVVAVSQARAMRTHIKAFQHSVNLTQKSELKAARTLSVVVVVFLICICPYYCVPLAGGDSLSRSSASFVLFLFYFNSCVNPVIYALFYPWFRKAVKHVVTLQILQPGSCEATIL